MVELKTLKDLEEHKCDSDDCCRDELILRLSEEAEKWVKECKNKKITFGEKNKFDISSKMFELFFNLEEK